MFRSLMGFPCEMVLLFKICEKLFRFLAVDGMILLSAKNYLNYYSFISFLLPGYKLN